MCGHSAPSVPGSMQGGGQRCRPCPAVPAVYKGCVAPPVSSWVSLCPQEVPGVEHVCGRSGLESSCAAHVHDLCPRLCRFQLQGQAWAGESFCVRCRFSFFKLPIERAWGETGFRAQKGRHYSLPSLTGSWSEETGQRDKASVKLCSSVAQVGVLVQVACGIYT